VSTTTDPVVCECGNPIPPYECNGHTYQARWCPACLEKKEAEERRINEEGKLVRLGFQKRFADSNFDNLHDPKPAPQVINACRNYALELVEQQHPTGKGIYLWGPNGTGKTHLAVAIIKTYGHALFVSTIALFDAIKTSYNTGEPCDVYEASKNIDLLVLDDLGAERPTDWVQERLFALLSNRYDELLSTVVTSNHSPTDLPRIVGQRSASRILGSCLTIEVGGIDHRRFASAAI